MSVRGELLTSWPITLRVAVLLAVLLTGTAAVAATLGIGGQTAARCARPRGTRAQSTPKCCLTPEKQLEPSDS